MAPKPKTTFQKFLDEIKDGSNKLKKVKTEATNSVAISDD